MSTPNTQPIVLARGGPFDPFTCKLVSSGYVLSLSGDDTIKTEK